MLANYGHIEFNAIIDTLGKIYFRKTLYRRMPVASYC